MEKKDRNNKIEKDEITLRYPLEFYYPRDKNLSFSEKHNVLKKIRSISEEKKEKINPLAKTDEVILFNLMMEDDLRNEYFEGVRSILNLLFYSPDPKTLYTTLFPTTEDRVKMFQNQFSDACDLILLKDKIDWKRMNISWYNFKVQEGFIHEQ